MSRYSWSDQAKSDVNAIISDTILNSFQDKIGDAEALYISPQEIIKYLPPELNITRNHIRKHHSGQWEIKNKHIHCFFGFQVAYTRHSDTKSVLKDLTRQNSEQYRYENYIENYIDDRKYTGICYICGRKKIPDPHFKRHICRVHGHFECYNYYCNGNKFTVGICLLDPRTETTPTRYQCANCGNNATFIRYELQIMNKQQGVEKAHRRDLCEACHIWGDCRLIFIQPSVICKALGWHGIICQWEWNKYKDGIFGSFEYNNEYHEFEVRPYMNCVQINSNKFYTKHVKYNNFSHDQKYSFGVYGEMQKHDQKYQKYINNRRRAPKKGNKQQKTKNNSTKKKKNVVKQNQKYSFREYGVNDRRRASKKGKKQKTKKNSTKKKKNVVKQNRKKPTKNKKKTK